MRVKNWREYQHYDPGKRAAPPWIRFYRKILDDHEWHELSGEASKVLVMLWLVAAEKDGRLPTSPEKLAFRLRTSETHIIKHLPSLLHWIECPASDVLAGCYQDALPVQCSTVQSSTEQTVGCSPTARVSEEAFVELWKTHPYGSKKDAREAYKKARGNGAPPDADLIVILKRQVQERKNADASGEFCARLPHLCRWFTHHRWEDAPVRQAHTETAAPARDTTPHDVTYNPKGQAFRNGKRAPEHDVQ